MTALLICFIVTQIKKYIFYINYESKINGQTMYSQIHSSIAHTWLDQLSKQTDWPFWGLQGSLSFWQAGWAHPLARPVSPQYSSHRSFVSFPSSKHRGTPLWRQLPNNFIYFKKCFNQIKGNLNLDLFSFFFLAWKFLNGKTNKKRPLKRWNWTRFFFQTDISFGK